MGTFPSKVYPDTPETVRCDGCGCDFRPTRDQWMHMHSRNNKRIFCTRECWRECLAREKAKRLTETKSKEEEKAKRREYKEKWLAKKRTQRAERLAAEAAFAEKRADEAHAAKVQLAIRGYIEELRKKMERGGKTQTTTRRSVKERELLGPDEPLYPPTKCAGLPGSPCKELTYDHRCPACKRAWRIGNGVHAGRISGEEYGGFSMSASGGIVR